MDALDGGASADMRTAAEQVLLMRFLVSERRTPLSQDSESSSISGDVLDVKSSSLHSGIAL